MNLTEKGARTRQRIIEETGQQLLDGGLASVTLDSVLAATGTSKSQLFHYFSGGKNELLREVAIWEGQQLFAAQRPELEDLSSIGSWQRWRGRLLDYYLGLGRWACPIGSMVQDAAGSDPALARLLAEGLARWQGALAAGVMRLVAAGGAPRSLDPERTAILLLSAIQGGIVLSRASADGRPLEIALDTALGFLAPTEET